MSRAIDDSDLYRRPYDARELDGLDAVALDPPRSGAEEQVKALARSSALNARAREGAVLVVEALDFAAPKTQAMAQLLAKLGVGAQKVLVLTHGAKPAVYKSARNLPAAHVMPFRDASTYHILWSDVVVVEAAALAGGEG